MYVNGSSSRFTNIKYKISNNKQYCMQWRNRVQTSYAAQGVDLGSIDNTAAGIQLISPNACYLNFTTPNFKFHGSIDYNNTASHCYFLCKQQRNEPINNSNNWYKRNGDKRNYKR